MKNTVILIAISLSLTLNVFTQKKDEPVFSSKADAQISRPTDEGSVAKNELDWKV